MANRYVQQRGVFNQLIVHAEHNGKPQRDMGYWDKRDGLGIAAEDVKYGEYPAATGVKSREDASLKRPYSAESVEEEAWLEAHIDAEVSIVVHYAGDDNLPAGVSRTYTGRVKGVNPPEGDKTASERAELTVVCIMDIDAS